MRQLVPRYVDRLLDLLVDSDSYVSYFQFDANFQCLVFVWGVQEVACRPFPASHPAWQRAQCCRIHARQPQSVPAETVEQSQQFIPGGYVGANNCEGRCNLNRFDQPRAKDRAPHD